MKVVILAALVAFGGVGCASADPAGDALRAKAFDCIRGNAPEVTAKASSLTDATQFLVSDLCVVEIEHAQTYATSEQTLSEWQATASAAQLVGISIDPVTGELKTPPTFQAPLNAGRIMIDAFRRVTTQSEFNAAAAHAILVARKPVEPH